MSSSVAAFRRGRPAPALPPAAAREHSIRRRVALVWGLLFLNVLTFYPTTWTGLPLAVPIPSKVGKVITQGALLGALLAALMLNRRRLIRPNVFLCLVSLLVLDALVAAMEAEHLLGTSYRTARLAMFVAVLWLLSPWWTRRDLLLVRCHLALTSTVLGSVLLGLLVAPRTAMAEGRLAGALWPIPPTGVAHFAAITIGLMVVFWLSNRASGHVTLLVVAVAGTMLLLTHTRTALVGMMAGILVAGLSLFIVKARARKLLVAAGIVVSIVALTLSSILTAWLTRGEDTQQLTSLTGRTTVWASILGAPRNEFQIIFGSGMSNLSFNGLPIDSNWLAAYNDLGLVGVILCALMLLFPLAAAYFQPRGVKRALALFLVTYCLVSSFTETGLSDPSLYLLELSLAASLLVPYGGDNSLATQSAAEAPAVLESVADRSLPADRLDRRPE